MRRPPHAPYRAGAPSFTPNMRPITPDRWLTPDTEAQVLNWKRKLLAEPERVLRQHPEGASAAQEAAALVSQAIGQTTDTLLDASSLVSDDLVVMEKRQSQWRCTALTLTAPTFFSIDEAFGQDLSALHGPVPDGARLAQRIGRVFDGLRPDQILERFNWTLQCGPDRHTPDGAPLRERAACTPFDEAEATIHLRVERQTIRRMPETGAVLFTIRVCLDPLSSIPAQDRNPLALAWRSLHGEGRDYKRWAAMDQLVEAVFESWGV